MKEVALASDDTELRVPGSPRSFSWFLQRIGDGSFHGECTEDLRELAAAMNQYVQDFRGVPKGKMVITLDFKLDKGAFEILATKKVTLPKRPAAGAIMWSDKNNNFSEQHPNQLSMFPPGPRSLDA